MQTLSHFFITTLKKKNNNNKKKNIATLEFTVFINLNKTVQRAVHCCMVTTQLCITKKNFLITYTYDINKRGSRGAAHAAKSLRWSVR